MSLDLYLVTDTPVHHKGTGVFIRENGETKELTKEEYKEKFGKEAKEEEYTDNNLLHINLTHNLAPMANKCGYKDESTTLYTLLWHPENVLGEDCKVTKEYYYKLVDFYGLLESNPDYYKQFNPKNGWGSYEQLISAVEKLMCTITPNLHKHITIESCI